MRTSDARCELNANALKDMRQHIKFYDKNQDTQPSMKSTSPATIASLLVTNNCEKKDNGIMAVESKTSSGLANTKKTAIVSGNQKMISFCCHFCQTSH